MPTESTSNNKVKILEEACSRNLPVELHHRTRKDELTVGRSRVLAMDEQFLYLDRPQCIGDSVTYGVGQELEAYLWLYDSLFTFKTQVADPSVTVSLNNQKRVTGISVKRPGTITPGQRRAYFRVSLAGVDEIAVELHSTSADEPGACPVEAKRLKGRVVDLSVSGASIKLDGVSYSSINVGDVYFMSFQLPEDSRLMYYLAEVRQTRAILDGSAARIGVQFSTWPSEQHMRLQQTLMLKFITKVQRMALKRSA